MTHSLQRLNFLDRWEYTLLKSLILIPVFIHNSWPEIDIFRTLIVSNIVNDNIPLYVSFRFSGADFTPAFTTERMSLKSHSDNEWLLMTPVI